MSSIELESSGINNFYIYSPLIDEEDGSCGPLCAVASNDKLVEKCAQNKIVLFYLRSIDNYWPMDESWCSFDKIYFGLSRLINVASVLNYTYLVFWFALAKHDYASSGIDLAIVIRTISAIPAQYINQCRLFSPAHATEVPILKDSAKVAATYWFVAIITNVISTIMFAYSSFPGGEQFFINEHFLSAYLSFSLFFLIVDTKTSSLLLDELHVLVGSKSLTMEKFVSTREEIHRRAKDSRWACDLIVVPCLACIITIVGIALFDMNQYEDQADRNSDIGLIVVMLKELFFIAVAFAYVAKVNARADELTVALSTTAWRTAYDKSAHNCDGSDIETEIDSVNTIHDRDSLLLDVERLSIHASSLSEPISFTLLFKRVSWRNVIIGAAGFVVTIVIAIIKSIVEAGIEK